MTLREQSFGAGGGGGSYTRRIIPLNASHMERAVLSNQAMFSAFAWVCTNVQNHKATKIELLQS